VNSRIARRLPFAALLLIAALSAFPALASPTDDSGPSIIDRIVRLFHDATRLFISHPSEDPVIPKP